MRKKVIVLGGSSGIGKATAERFAREGWQVLLTGIDPAQYEETRQNLPGEGHQALRLDARSSTDIQRLTETVERDFGRIDAFINSIGIAQNLPVVGSDFQAWDTALQVMLYGSVHLCRALVPLLNNGGRIIHITSIHHHRVAFGSSAYGMAKAALTQLTRSLAIELAPRNILANAIAPGFVDTPLSIKADGQNELASEWFTDNYIRYDHLPLKRAAQPEEIAGVAWFLAGPDAGYITGSVLTVDGGLTITF
ncbi:3-oxoacyl-[acyl-carrier-protein] reductase [Nibrella viscosa]|uniref:3-oxoacyl-[acyl-carrier-protein] reductase n=1 Tax=Nibrella viscosa TaxID=1084524 RepID=A0ABP8KDW7_9BACT